MAYSLEAVRQDEQSRIRLLIRMIIRNKAIFTLINIKYIDSVLALFILLIIIGKPAEKQTVKEQIKITTTHL